MIDLMGVVIEKITNDAPTLALLGTYSGQPIWEDGFVPFPNAWEEKPGLVVEPPANVGNPATLDYEMREEVVNLRLYAKPGDNGTLPLVRASEAIRALFKNWSADVTGGRVVNTTVLGPTPGVTEDPTLGGRLLAINLLIKETA